MTHSSVLRTGVAIIAKAGQQRESGPPPGLANSTQVPIVMEKAGSQGRFVRG